MLAPLIKKRSRPYAVRIVTGGYVGTRWVEQEEERELELYIVPLGFNELIETPEGTYDSQDVKIYRAAEADIPERSVVVFQGREYEVRKGVWREAGGFSMYLGRRK